MKIVDKIIGMIKEKKGSVSIIGMFEELATKAY